jgi:hypothetical protein
VIDFKLDKKDRLDLAAQMFKRACMILKKENIKFDKAAVVEVVKKYFPDNRRILNELQRYSVSGAIDTGILSNVREISLSKLVKSLKDKNFTEVRKWVAENSDTDSADIFRKIYDKSSSFVSSNSVPQLVLILAEYQFKAAHVADQEINLTACLVEIMANIQFT